MIYELRLKQAPQSRRLFHSNMSIVLLLVIGIIIVIIIILARALGAASKLN